MRNRAASMVRSSQTIVQVEKLGPDRAAHGPGYTAHGRSHWQPAGPGTGPVAGASSVSANSWGLISTAAGCPWSVIVIRSRAWEARRTSKANQARASVIGTSHSCIQLCTSRARKTLPGCGRSLGPGTASFRGSTTLQGFGYLPLILVPAQREETETHPKPQPVTTGRQAGISAR